MSMYTYSTCSGKLDGSAHLGRVLLGLTVSGCMVFLCVCSIGENRFWLVWLINLFNQPQSKLKSSKKHVLDYVAWL